MTKSFLAVIPLVLLAACSSNPPMPNVAQMKSVDVGDQTITLGGEYWVEKNQLTIFVNNEPLLRGSFPPFTPTLRLNGMYEGIPIESNCYFGTVLQSKGGVVGAISGAIQGAKGKSADKCEMLVDDQTTETLYF